MRQTAGAARTAIVVLLVAALVAAEWCARTRGPDRGAGAPPAMVPPAMVPTPLPAAPSAGAGPGSADASRRSGAPIRPNPALTPGATLPVTAADICVPGYSQKVRNVPAAVKRAVYARYGIATHAPGEYEVDHLISLELGGSNAERNLWPESFRTQPLNAHVKDRLENELHRRVCAGTLDLGTAQQAIARDWIAAYRRYVGPLPAR